MKKYFAIFTGVVAILMAGCEKNEIQYAVTEPVNDKALLKFNYASGYAANPPVQISIDGARVSPLIQFRTPYPGGGYNTLGLSAPDYLMVNPGTHEVKVSIPAKGTNMDSVVLYQTSINVAANQRYTAHITDTAANTQTLLIQEDIRYPDSANKARYKFVNLMPNVPAIDLYFGTTKIQSNIPYLGVSDYFEVTIPSALTTWAVREAGTSSTSPALASYGSANTYISKRLYTVFAIGYKGQTDAARRPYVSFLLN